VQHAGAGRVQAAGISGAGIKTRVKDAYFRDAAVAFKKKVSLPLILVGENCSFEAAERLVKDGKADYIAMSRPFT